MQQRVPKGPKPTTTPERAQPAVEAEAEDKRGSEEAGVHMPRTIVRPPQPGSGARGPDGDQEAL